VLLNPGGGPLQKPTEVMVDSGRIYQVMRGERTTVRRTGSNQGQTTEKRKNPSLKGEEKKGGHSKKGKRGKKETLSQHRNNKQQERKERNILRKKENNDREREREIKRGSHPEAWCCCYALRAFLTEGFQEKGKE